MVCNDQRAVMIEGKAIQVRLVDGVEVAGEQYTYSMV